MASAFVFSGLAIAALGLTATSASAAPLKVACTGTSAMMGLGSTAGHHVPDEMGKVLGPNFEVGNFGVQGTTAIKSVGASYAATSQYRAALALNPDVVLFWFGGNDSFSGTWETHKGEFKADYTAMVKAFQDLPSRPRTFLVRLWVFPGGPVRQTVLDQEILPIIGQIAAETNSTLIDYRKLVETHREWFPDGMHPNDAGTLAIGKLFADTVTMALAGAADGGVSDAGGVAVDGATAGDVAPSTPDAPAAETSSPPIMTGTGGATGGSGGASAGGSGGTGTGGATGSGGAPGSTTGAGGGGGTTPPPATSSGGGGCRLGQGPASGSAALLIAALAVLLSVRRRRPSPFHRSGGRT